MPENIGGPSAPFNTQIPSIVDNADIQTAFRLYHYGSNTSTPGTIPEESLSGHLQKIDNDKINKVPDTIPGSANLNDYVTTGFYTQTSNTFALTGLNYPEKFAGLLNVVNDEGVVFQQYQVIGAPESGESPNTINRTFWRFNIAGSWRPWRTFIETSDFSNLGDPRYVQGLGGSPTFISNYYTRSQADEVFYTKISAEQSRYVEEVQVSGDRTLQLSDVGKVIAVAGYSSDITITIPTNFEVPIPVGTLINVYAAGTAPVIISSATGVSLRPSSSVRLFEQYTEVSLRKRDLNEWVISGNFLSV